LFLRFEVSFFFGIGCLKVWLSYEEPKEKLRNDYFTMYLRATPSRVMIYAPDDKCGKWVVSVVVPVAIAAPVIV
jgi:hypothetical protein